MNSTTPTSENYLPPELSWVRRGRTYTYRMTDEDTLVLAQAIAHEGRPRDGVVWCLIQRFCWLFPIYRTLSRFLRAYVQPINPKWFPGGKLHRRELARIRRRYRDDPGQMSTLLENERGRAQRRVGYARDTWTDFRPYVTQTLSQFFAGELSNPVPGAVHYRVPTTRTTNPRLAQYAARGFASAHHWHVVDSGNGFLQGTNWFFSVNGSHGLVADWVRIGVNACQM